VIAVPRSAIGPACGGCGAPIARVNDARTGGTFANFHGVRLVAGTAGEADAVYRCEKHVGRNPCCIPGCGRTYAHRGDTDGRGAEDYSWRLICGGHWRQAPKFMRDALSRVRRQAKRTGWTDRQHARHSRLWSRCVRAILAGHVDRREIDRMFGWDQSG
jgi:hypothetical protein